MTTREAEARGHETPGACLELPSISVPPPGPRSLALAARLAAVECPDTTFFTPEFPVFWESARGANVWDADGNRYVDLSAAFGVAAVGHAHPRVVEAIRAQVGRLIHGMGDVHPTETRLELAEALARRAPGGGAWRVAFAGSGSEAVEIAVKTAAIATGRPGVITFEDAYHGLSLGALQYTSWPKFREGLGAMAPGPEFRLPYPSAGAAPDSAKAETSDMGAFVRIRLREMLEGPGARERIGAILCEPIQGRGGIVVPPAGFLPELRRICDQYGLLLIFDEVYTGFGRTGSWFACGHEGVVPDLIAVGKALGGGMPIGACLGRAEVMDKWGASRGEARHTSTFLGHPLACAAALATLGVIESEGLVERSAEMGREFAGLLRERLGRLPRVGAVRGRGMMIGVELVNPADGSPDPAGTWAAVVEGLRRGLILLPCGRGGSVLSLTPPLTLAREQMEFAVDGLSEILGGGV